VALHASPPGEGWQQADFDDSGWTEGHGGFGTRHTPGARVGTDWSTNNIWLRKTFPLAAVPEKPALLIHHDEDAEIFVNGQLLATFEGYTVEYKVVPIEAEKRALLRAGNNVMAVHCRQTIGGQFIDVHLVDAANVPKLPPPKRSTRPFISELITSWGEAVTPENVWRSTLGRNWSGTAGRTLNGHWDYAITVSRIARPRRWAGQDPGSLLPGIETGRRTTLAGRLRSACGTAARSRLEPSTGQRTLLNFEAVDYRCDVFVNGQLVGSHQGGNTPFRSISPRRCGAARTS
jgi:hypothetical protein